jgi:hypothetical protein
MRLLEPLDLLLCARRRLLRRSKPRHDLHASLQQQNHPSWPTDPPRSHRVGRRLFTSASSLPPATGTAWRLHHRASPRKPYRGQTSLRVGDRVHNAARGSSVSEHARRITRRLAAAPSARRPAAAPRRLAAVLRACSAACDVATAAWLPPGTSLTPRLNQHRVRQGGACISACGAGCVICT